LIRSPQWISVRVKSLPEAITLRKKFYFSKESENVSHFKKVVG
jgi:hypothetical protein